MPQQLHIGCRPRRDHRITNLFAHKRDAAHARQGPLQDRVGVHDAQDERVGVVGRPAYDPQLAFVGKGKEVTQLLLLQTILTAVAAFATRHPLTPGAIKAKVNDRRFGRMIPNDPPVHFCICVCAVIHVTVQESAHLHLFVLYVCISILLVLIFVVVVLHLAQDGE